MRQLFAVFATGLCLALPTQGFAQEGPQAIEAQLAVSSETQAEIAGAEANRSRVVTRPSRLTAPDWEFPESERALGHNGIVVIRGLLSVDGRLRYLTVATSSRAPGLDTAALSWVAGSTFSPAKDAEGSPLAIMISVPVEYFSHNAPDGYGASHYTCRQFVLDMDWWRAAFPEESVSHHRFYEMVHGLGIMARMEAGAERALSAESNEAFLQRWDASVESCRSRPDARFAEVMHPEGDIADRLARQHGVRP